jgi:hypothetical protein
VEGDVCESVSVAVGAVAIPLDGGATLPRRAAYLPDMHSKLIAVTLGILLLSFTPIATACEAPSVPPGDDLNYFALLLRDAQVNNCAQSAHDKLLLKLDSNTWNTERVGVVLSYALAAGLVLGGNGHMSQALDTKLTLAANNYVFTPQAGCGFTSTTWQNGNTCLEDHAIAALANGWRTAWYRLTARDWSTDRTATITQIRNALSETVNCIHPTMRAAVRATPRSRSSRPIRRATSR